MRTSRLHFLPLVLLLVALATLSGMAFAPPTQPMRALIFTRTAGYRHDSIPAGIEALRAGLEKDGFTVEASEDPALFTDDSLARFRVIVFLSTTGDILNDDQQRAFEQWYSAGSKSAPQSDKKVDGAKPEPIYRGFVGIHAAADTEYDWPFYHDLLGAQFKSHPAIQEAVIKHISSDHPSTKFLPERWQRTDEWYNYRTNPRDSGATVLLALDTTSYQGDDMAGDHPICWCREKGGCRMWYTGLGHTKESYSDPMFMRHVLAGIRWAAHRDD